MKRHDLTGQRYGTLTVLRRAANRTTHGKAQWICECDCGEWAVVIAGDLLNGTTKSCGCLQRLRTSQARTTHGLSATRAYSTWKQMMARCYEPTAKGYESYGGRGIRVHPRWVTVGGFVADMGHPPEGRTLERINNDGNYEPANCRWGTPREQAQNRRSTRMVTYRGETLCAAEWARRIGVNRSTILRRLSRLPVDEALGEIEVPMKVTPQSAQPNR
jgi:hypothetical protein